MIPFKESDLDTQEDNFCLLKERRTAERKSAIIQLIVGLRTRKRAFAACIRDHEKLGIWNSEYVPWYANRIDSINKGINRLIKALNK
jgi:hypothetical protein